jgi:hypothetical protein
MSRRTAVRLCHAARALGAALAILTCASLVFGQASNQKFDIKLLPIGGAVEREINKYRVR